MRHHREARHGDGTAWLVADDAQNDYLCYWYVGRADDRLAEQARVATTADALAWGRLRSPRVRIRPTGTRTYWAGTGARPAGFSHTWGEEHQGADSF